MRFARLRFRRPSRGSAGRTRFRIKISSTTISSNQDGEKNQDRGNGNRLLKFHGMLYQSEMSCKIIPSVPRVHVITSESNFRSYPELKILHKFYVNMGVLELGNSRNYSGSDPCSPSVLQLKSLRESNLKVTKT